ncbi:hypothetical protein, partial [Ferruginibacter sp. HRS2-29]|uniref:hypothetical protein n=1 Tax=Ferruginibacter sp. HRS2-29 TaxID=2487334 RepID=UPI0020CD1ACF
IFFCSWLLLRIGIFILGFAVPTRSQTCTLIQTPVILRNTGASSVTTADGSGMPRHSQKGCGGAFG